MKCASGILLIAFAVAAARQPRGMADEADRSTAVRVGIVAFDELAEGRNRVTEVLRNIAAGSKDLRFQMAIGTYGDVEHWMNQGLIDLAVVTPGLFTIETAFAKSDAHKTNTARNLDSTAPAPSDLLTDRVRYLATIGAPAAVTPWAAADRREGGYHDRVHSVGLVRRDSALETIEDIERAAKEGRLRYLMVHPLSVSGCIAPRFALKQLGVEMRQVQIEYTHSHSASVRALLDDSVVRDDRATVAFVWDDALRNDPVAANKLRAIPFPQLDTLAIPQDMVVARRDFKRADEVRKLLLAYHDSEGGPLFSSPPDWSALHGDVLRWRTAAVDGEDQNQSVTIDEVGRLLLHYARTQPQRPRLALVLSGGGAKCSYQVGAVAAIEEKLAQLRATNPDAPLDIDLVVGTSGGAINALPVAIGVTRSEAGRQQFRDVWRSLDQREIVLPSWSVRANIGLWFALVEMAITLGLVHLIVRNPARRAWWVGGAFLALGTVQMTVGYIELSPWRLLGGNHWVHHAWLWLAFGARASAWSLLVIGVALLLAQAVRRRKCAFVTAPRRVVTWTLAVGLIGLPLVQIVTLLFLQDTLSGGEGMEQALAIHYPVLIDGELSRRRLEPLDLSTAESHSARLRSAGRQLVERGLLRRDLVITGSRLQSAKENISALPSDLYFYLQGEPADNTSAARSAAPPFGNRGVSLAKRPELTLDVVLGSGSIFPVFPSRRLDDFPGPGDEIELVDGGFAHNSPIEAAVMWGATHIILIEASPEIRLERTSFATNAAASFDHLYQQSQLLDARSRGKIAIFTLVPEPPHLCVLDFADNLIEDSIERGYRDVAGHAQQTAKSDGQSNGGTIHHRPRFRKELGEPMFVDVE